MSASLQNDPEFDEAIPKSKSPPRSRLLEYLVVLGIIGLTAALLLPAVRTARPAAGRAQCANNLKQIAMALHNYEQVYKVLPPLYTVDAAGRPLHSWRTLILPYLEQESLYRTIDLSKPWNDPANAGALGTFVNSFRCPATVHAENETTYLAIVSPNGCFFPVQSRRLSEITDAHGATLMVIEAGEEDAVPWMAPMDADEALVMRLGSTSKLQHPGGTHACFVDGSVRFLKASITARVRRGLISISGHDDPGNDEY